MNLLSHLLEHKIVAIVRGAESKDVVQIASALHEGGIKNIEITLNSPNALEAIEKVAKEFKGEMLVGAGTVLDSETARGAILAGAQFILAPTVNIETIKMTKRYGAISIPGAFSPTEILTAYENGADIVKVFPASIGAQYIKDIRGPLPHIPLLPTGGVTLDNIGEFQAAGAVGFGIGSSLVNTKREINASYLKELTIKARQYVEAIHSNQKENV
ncbi:bifunctional 4-hydroxy-2-oxoglutarate aldolase/2-dehydro-3-deoxy-phosphogluconate aldolase [Priestia filamentosa]|uniref:bifunctional 4-hydroxy-2-oxoglutarate aldolase/2-dehydro-3-deoxy-phosphogluconate aldolase n=1 Tax=Priestia filamentosa TaxID=1402861 RepID=UPI00030E7C5C|nr:bifunctional 4-hydroxy-2-oxoglutarate aldolase/2-dehydro-3-deoxy-phosphogluconate aldolase [Priestia filamentosa]